MTSWLWIAVALAGITICLAHLMVKRYPVKTPPLREVLSTPWPKWERPINGGFEHLPEDMIRFMQEEGVCPYCHSLLMIGPAGGMSVNVFCAEPDCNSRFNLGVPPLPFGEFTGECPADFIAERRAQRDKYIPHWHG